MAHIKVIGIGLGVLGLALAAYGAAALWPARATPVSTTQQDVIATTDVAQVAPHKAIYKIEMVEKRSGTQVLDISGEMFFEWKPVCEAWTTDHRFNLLYSYADSPPMRITSDFATYERHAGDTFDFNSRRRRDGELYEELRGQATMPSHTAAGQALFTLPDGLSFDLPSGTLFPMAHTMAVIKAAREGKKFYAATIFDGSDEEGPAEVNAFIGAPVNAMAQIAPSATIDSALINVPAWNVRLAFFPLNSDEADSDYEMNVVFHENGVISDMIVEYKDFTVTQKLVALERVRGADCATPTGGKAQ